MVVRVIADGPAMWTNDNRAAYERKSCRYPSDLTDEEWAIVSPLMPPPRKARRHPVPETRELLNAILYVLTTGCQWRQLPKDFPSKSVVHDDLVCWDRDGVLARVHDALYAKARELAGRNATASLGIVDSQSVKGAEKRGLRSILAATTPARRSKARSATSASIRKAS
jgi:transposase